MNNPYISSCPDFLKDFKQGDHVFCFETSEFTKFIKTINDNEKHNKELLMDLLEEIIILENDEDLKDLKKHAKKLHLRLNNK